MTTMKAQYMYLLVVCGCVTALAVTEQWRYAVRASVQQIVSDSKGGCVVSDRDVSNFVSVVWLTSKGAVQFTSGVVTGSPIGAMIHDCTASQLLYTGTPGFPMMVQVSKKGTMTPVVAIGGYLFGNPMIIPPYSASRLQDKKGFFVVNVNTNSGVESVVRYLYK
jgi:hypothetical protein